MGAGSYILMHQRRQLLSATTLQVTKLTMKPLRAPEAHPIMNCDSEAYIPVSQIMVEMVDVASFHTTGTRAESHRQNVVVPIRQTQWLQ